MGGREPACAAPGLPDRLPSVHLSTGSTGSGRLQKPPTARHRAQKIRRDEKATAVTGETQRGKNYSSSALAAQHAGSVMRETAHLLSGRSCQKHCAGNQSKTVIFPFSWEGMRPHLWSPGNRLVQIIKEQHLIWVQDWSSIKVEWANSHPKPSYGRWGFAQKEPCAPTPRISASVLAKCSGTTAEQTPSPFSSAHTTGLRANGGNS